MYDMSEGAASRDRSSAPPWPSPTTAGSTKLTIRSLAQRLGAKPMSLYHYVANKDEILDGLVDLVFAEIELPAPTGRLARGDGEARALGPRGAAPAPLGDRPARVADHAGPGHAAPPRREHRTLRAGGFSVAQTAHAYAVLDAFVYGFAVQEASLPFEGPDGAAAVAGPIMELMGAGEYPHMVEFATASTRCSPATTSVPSSTSGSTWSSTASPGCSRTDLSLTGSRVLPRPVAA